jgi:signal transduction histidine kinase
MRPRTWLTLASVGAIALTDVSVTGVVDFAYRSPALHVAVETAAALISLLAAQLMYGRFRRSHHRQDMLLTAALAAFAATNMLFLAIPAIAELDAERFTTWAPAFGGALAAALLAAGAYGAPRAVRSPKRAMRKLIVLCSLILLLIGVTVALTSEWLPQAIPPGLSPESGSRPRIVGDPVMLGLQLLIMALFAVAAVGLAQNARRSSDPLILCFAIGATLGGWARLNYFLFPSLYSDYFYTGDVLRLGFFVALLVGGALEIRVAQRELEQVAILNERRRLGREVHDGIAQDLAFIVQQTDALAGRPDAPQIVGEIAVAARRALAESRDVIASARPIVEPLDDALTRVAKAAAARWGATVEADIDPGLDVPAQTRDALVRIVGEAVTNAARHGRAQTVSLQLRADPQLRLVIDDNGIGFDPESLVHGDGIVGMRERAEALGGELRIGSRRGEGTRISLVLP